MKIAILSMQRIVNFGSVLQAYSLRHMIREVTGQTPVFLDIDRGESVPSRKSVSEGLDYEAPAAYPPGLLQKAKRFAIAKLSAYNKRKIRRFMERELGLSAQTAAEQFDVTVIGSDEVFNHNGDSVCLQLHGKVRQARRVITYAAACGNARADDIAPEDKLRVRQAMENLKAISVRDAATARYVQALTGRQTQHHLDPVLTGPLHRRPHRGVPLKNYLLVYAYGHRIRTQEEISAITAYARSKGLKTVAMGGSQFWTDLYIPASPWRLLDYVYHANCVITDTFHGTIFSVIHHRPFAVLQRVTNREKITGLLADLGLEDRLTGDIQNLARVLDSPVDYEAVEQILEKERARTREYLKEQLGD